MVISLVNDLSAKLLENAGLFCSLFEVKPEEIQGEQRRRGIEKWKAPYAPSLGKLGRQHESGTPSAP